MERRPSSVSLMLQVPIPREDHLRAGSPSHKLHTPRLSVHSRAPTTFFLRLSLLTLVILSSVLALTRLNPSPWLATTPALFLRPPPPLSILPGSTPPVQGCQDTHVTVLEARENAAVVLLVREADLAELIPTLANFETRFNRQFRYPYVFLSSPDVPTFSKSFRVAVAKALPPEAVVEWGEVPLEHWRIPSWMDEKEVRKGFAAQEAAGVQYAGREGYHHMCRWYAGLWARHLMLAKYDWYWRLEPGVRFFCSVTYDPFRFLSMHNKVYGFVISIVENANTIPTLFEALKDYAVRNDITPAPAMWDFFTRRNKLGEEEYNLCHMWTNFEIGDLRFFRAKQYQALFEELDQAGGFYTERWGDAPIRSLALGLLTDVNQVHYFEDFAYQHDWFVHCPAKSGGLGCACDCPKTGKGGAKDSKTGNELIYIDNDWRYSCMDRWKEAQAKGWHSISK